MQLNIRFPDLSIQMANMKPQLTPAENSFLLAVDLTAALAFIVKMFFTSRNYGNSRNSSHPVRISRGCSKIRPKPKTTVGQSPNKFGKHFGVTSSRGGGGGVHQQSPTSSAIQSPVLPEGQLLSPGSHASLDGSGRSFGGQETGW